MLYCIIYHYNTKTMIFCNLICTYVYIVWHTCTLYIAMVCTQVRAEQSHVKQQTQSTEPIYDTANCIVVPNKSTSKSEYYDQQRFRWPPVFTHMPGNRAEGALEYATVGPSLSTQLLSGHLTSSSTSMPCVHCRSEQLDGRLGQNEIDSLTVGLAHTRSLATTSSGSPSNSVTSYSASARLSRSCMVLTVFFWFLCF